MMDFTLLKQHLRIDGDEEDDLLQSYINAAELLIRRETGKNYVLEAGEYVDIAGDMLFQQAVKMLVAHWYECRQPLAAAAMEVPFAVTQLTSQIALGSAYYEADESAEETEGEAHENEGNSDEDFHG